MQWAVHNTLHTAHYTLHTANCTLHTTHFTLHTTHFTLHTTHYTLHTTHYTLHTEHFIAWFRGVKEPGLSELVNRNRQIYKNNSLTEISRGSEAGSHLKARRLCVSLKSGLERNTEGEEGLGVEIRAAYLETFVGIHRQKLTRTSQNQLLNTPTKGREFAAFWGYNPA